jgi:predicted transcriptional regulator
MQDEYDFRQGKRGAVLPPHGKTRITIYIDDEVLEAFRHRAEQQGHGYQTMMNQALREYLALSHVSLDEATLRRVLREELKEVKSTNTASVPSRVEPSTVVTS